MKAYLPSITMTLVCGSLLLAGCAAQESTLTGLSKVESVQEPATQDPEENPGLFDPSKANKQAPDSFKVKFETTQGDFVVEATRSWAPNGVDRFYNMVDVGYFDNVVIFRAIDNFMFQFGIHGDPKIANAWKSANIKDDEFAGNSNLPMTLSFAQTGMPNSRSSQMFVNLGNNAFLDKPRQGSPFVPFAKVVEGQDVVKKIYTDYGENDGQDQGRFMAEGNKYILKKYPKLDIIKSAKFVKEEEGGQ